MTKQKQSLIASFLIGFAILVGLDQWTKGLVVQSFFLIAVLVLGAVAYLIYKMPSDGKYRPLAVCLMMISAGAVGNMIDRVSQGYVVDFLYFKLINFPIFNVADCYVTIGAACLVFLIMFYYKDEDMACFSLKKQ